MTISERIFERLRQLSMTQKEFAESSGIQQSTISEWKKKKTNPSSDKILAICKTLDVSPEWLLSGVDRKIQENVAMFVGMCFFTGFNYLGQRLFAFKEEH